MLSFFITFREKQIKPLNFHQVIANSNGDLKNIELKTCVLKQVL